MLLRYLEYLDALARVRHFARAAEVCHVSQPALSAGIRKLETELGVQVVRRGHRFEGFTPEGERVVASARRMLAERDALCHDLTAMRGALSGVLRIGAIPTALTAVALLTEPFSARHPLVRLAVESLSSRQIVRQLAAFELDVGITYIDGEPLGAVRTVPLYRERYLLLTPEGGPFAERDSIGWAELSEVPLCLLPSNMQNRRILNQHFAEAGVTILPKLESDTISVLYAHVSTHRWSTVIAQPWLHAFGVPDGMQLIPIARPQRAHHVGLVLADREPPPMLARALLDVATTLDMRAELERLINRHTRRPAA
ncbi:LysR substrate-binding domain-containing protein [Micromonospora sp. NPDC048830]|uniref:LysR family transcriptional regulator n=1 Tax=Micromonospora sp. NPDC048830 TaxID=3364257 RepID=UPI00371F15F4